MLSSLMQEPSGVSSIFDEKAYLSALDWWRLAGVDEAISEEPVDWLAETAKPVAEFPQAEDAPAIEALPATLAEFREWLMTSDALPEPLTRSARIAPSGPEQAEVVVMIDMAESEDRGSGRLWSGSAGVLLDAMLRAIDLDREKVAMIPLVPGRTATGRPADEALNRWGEIGRHHLALSGAKQILLMGESVSRAILGMNLSEARGELRSVNHDSAEMQVVATFDARFLLRQPMQKRDAWGDLLMFAKGLSA